MKHHGPKFAVYLARLINHRRPLIDRLRDPAVTLDQVERAFLADVLEDRVKWPRGGSKSVRIVRRHVKYAKALTDGRWRWWDMASRLARKGKIKQLHRTY